MYGDGLRSAGMALVDSSNIDWRESAKYMIRSVNWSGHHLTGEDIKMRLRSLGIGDPKNPNAWGSLIYWASSQGIIKDSGMLRKSKLPSAHARRAIVWEVA